MSTDLTFFTNEPNRNLLDRFKVLIKDTELFDVLVGYFFTSGFYAIYKSLEKTDKIRILIGYLTVEQVAKQLGLSEYRIRQFIREKQIRATKIGQWRVKPEDLEEFVKVRTNK